VTILENLKIYGSTHDYKNELFKVGLIFAIGFLVGSMPLIAQHRSVEGKITIELKKKINELDSGSEVVFTQQRGDIILYSVIESEK